MYNLWQQSIKPNFARLTLTSINSDLFIYQSTSTSFSGSYREMKNLDKTRFPIRNGCDFAASSGHVACEQHEAKQSDAFVSKDNASMSWTDVNRATQNWKCVLFCLGLRFSLIVSGDI